MCTRVQLSQTAANWRQHYMLKSKNGKNWVFSPTEGDRISRSRPNLAHKRIHWSAIAQQIWPSSVKGGRYRRRPKVKICQKLWLSPSFCVTLMSFKSWRCGSTSVKVRRHSHSACFPSTLRRQELQFPNSWAMCRRFEDVRLISRCLR